MTRKVLPTHLERRALVYVRQSTTAQVRGHPESTNRQYDLVERAARLGWSPTSVEVIDEDLGRSGASAERRTGFRQLAQAVAQGTVGAILALEVSRLARSSVDWQQLLRLCGVAEVLVVDEERIYDPRDSDDRLLLDIKGSMSEMELSWLSLRMAGARQNKARRGELSIRLPTGYVQGQDGPEMDPDEAVRAALRTVFSRFEVEASANAVVRWAGRTGFQIPVRDSRSGSASTVAWKALTVSRIISILHNPIYAGAYAYGRASIREIIRGEEIVKTRRRNESGDWPVRLLDSHPGYIAWEDYLRNQEKLRGNLNQPGQTGGAPREGPALLSGLLTCGRCGSPMRVAYWPARDRARFLYCCAGDRARGGSSCWAVRGNAVDAAVERLFLQAAAPDELELTLAVQERIEHQSDELTRGWQLRLERAEYEARLSERRYKAVDPDNRVVARSLERDWETKLREVENLRQRIEEVKRQDGLCLTEERRRRIRELASNLELVWRAETTANEDRKAMLRTAIEAVVLLPVEEPRALTSIRVGWKSGAVSEINVPRYRKGERRATPPEAIERIRAWAAEGLRDDAMADLLNRAGLRTGTGKAWSPDAVLVVRRRAHIRLGREANLRLAALPDRHPDGRYSVRGAAKHFGVTKSSARRWIARGLVQAAREDYGRHRGAWWISIGAAEEERLRNRPPRRPPNPDRLPDGRYSISGAARRFGVPVTTLRGWVKRGLIKWNRQDHGPHRGVYLLEISEADAAEIERMADTTCRRRRSQSENQ